MSVIGFQYSREVGGAILGSTVGSVATYLVQSSQERETWTREDQLFLVREIYGPLNQAAISTLSAIPKARQTGDFSAVYSAKSEPPYQRDQRTAKDLRLVTVLESYWLDFADSKIAQLARELNCLLNEGSDSMYEANSFFYTADFVNLFQSVNGSKFDQNQGLALQMMSRTNIRPYPQSETLSKQFLLSFLMEKRVPPSARTDFAVTMIVAGGSGTGSFAPDRRLDQLWTDVSSFPAFGSQLSKIAGLNDQIEKTCTELSVLTERRVRTVFRP